MTRIEKSIIFAPSNNKKSSYMENMETRRNINLELATSAQSLKNELRKYHNLLVEKYNIDGRTYEGAIHRLYDYLDVIDQLDDLIAQPNPFADNVL